MTGEGDALRERAIEVLAKQAAEGTGERWTYQRPWAGEVADALIAAGLLGGVRPEGRALAERRGFERGWQTAKNQAWLVWMSHDPTHDFAVLGHRLEAHLTCPPGECWALTPPGCDGSSDHRGGLRCEQGAGPHDEHCVYSGSGFPMFRWRDPASPSAVTGDGDAGPEHELLWLLDLTPPRVACRCGLMMPTGDQDDHEVQTVAVYWWHAHYDRALAHPEHHDKFLRRALTLTPFPMETCAMERLDEQDEPCPRPTTRVGWRDADGTELPPRWVCQHCEIWIGDDDD